MIEAIVQGVAATIMGGAAIGLYREGKRTTRLVQKHDRTLYGTDYRPGVVRRVEEIEDEVTTDHA